MNFKSIIFFVIVLIAFGCKQSKKSLDNLEDEISWEKKESKIIIDSSIHLDSKTLKVDQFNYSGNGNVFLIDSNIVFYDNLFGVTTIVSSNGKIKKQYGGLDTLEPHNKWIFPYTISKFANGYSSIFQRSIAYVDSSYKICSIKNIKFKGKENLVSILDIPNPNNMTVYELNERDKSSFQISENEIVVSIESEAPSFNPYNSIEYFKKAHPFGLVNIKKASLSSIPITRSNIYGDTCCLSVQDGAYFLKIDSLYHIQFAADTLIYVYNQKFTPKYAYGLSGSFIPNRIYNNGLEIAFDDEKYQNLKQKANVIESLFLYGNNLIGRIANNRINNKKYLQIYKDKDLIYEKEILANFNFIGVSHSSIIGLLKENDNNIRLCIIK